MKFTLLAAISLVSSGMIIVLGGVHSEELHSGNKCKDTYTNSTSWSPQYLDREDDVACKKNMLGSKHLDYQCVRPESQPKPKKYHTDHNQTYTPECPSRYTDEKLIGGESEKNIGQCRKQSNCRELGGTSKKCAPTIAEQCVSVFILLLFLATIVFDPHSYFYSAVAEFYYYCYHFIDYIS